MCLFLCNLLVYQTFDTSVFVSRYLLYHVFVTFVNFRAEAFVGKFDFFFVCDLSSEVLWLLLKARVCEAERN